MFSSMCRLPKIYLSKLTLPNEKVIKNDFLEDKNALMGREYFSCWCHSANSTFRSPLQLKLDMPKTRKISISNANILPHVILKEYKLVYMAEPSKFLSTTNAI